MSDLQKAILIVEGSIGADKTTFIKELIKVIEHENKTYKIYEEEILKENKRLLEKYYDNLEVYGQEIQNWIIRSRQQQIERMKNENVEIIIFDRGIISTRIFTRLQRKEGLLTKTQKKQILDRTIQYKEYFKDALVLYLTPGIEEEIKRTTKRNRNIENKVTEQYLRKLSKTYQKEIGKEYSNYHK